MSLQTHLFSDGPKRILALDGGGIRGALSLGYLQRMEELLRQRHGGDASFRLCDYFDLIGGTSTGSIIASCLAIGMCVEEIKEKYFQLGGKIFGKKYHWWDPAEWKKLIRAGYDVRPMQTELHNVFGDITMGSDKIRTGLCIVTKRADTNSIWPIINHPAGKYFDSDLGKNKDILLWKAVMASSAAPTYFMAQLINVGGGASLAAFIDGGVSMANNPSLQLLMVATLKGFPFRWSLGADNILLVSVGTGMSEIVKLPDLIAENSLLDWARQVPYMLLQDASWQNQAILQWLSKTPTACIIDGEIGDMKEDILSLDSKGLLSYLRYNINLTRRELSQLMNKEYTEHDVLQVSDMSNTSRRFELYDIGYAAGKANILSEHFADCFNCNEEHQQLRPSTIVSKDNTLPDIEIVSETVHEAWQIQKEKQGFHAPIACPGENHQGYINAKRTGKGFDQSIDERKTKWCPMCHPNMYPYSELSDDEKELDRATVRAVYEAIGNARLRR